jgi:hypothetical protein
MKNYLDQLDIEQHQLTVKLTLTAIVDNGVPDVSVSINDVLLYSDHLKTSMTISHIIPLLSPIDIKIVMTNKSYSDSVETGIKIESLMIDNVDMVPHCVDRIAYHNDQQQQAQAFYLGFNGVWQFGINEPFYRWWHRASGQGWLLEPAPI